MASEEERRQLELMQTIFGVISRRDVSIDQQIAEILKEGCSLFGEQIGIVSRIDGDTYVVEHVYAPDFDIKKGQKFELKETFCSITIGSEKPLSIADVKNSDYRKHPCTNTGIESYIGMSIIVEGSKFGTLNFSSTSPKDQSLLDTDLEFMTTLSDWTGNVLGYSRLLNRLNTLASKDSLTELSNRSAILEKIERCLERHKLDKGYAFAVLFIDLDRFKPVNDRLGHKIGDLLLRQVAKRLQSMVRPRDSLGRYGGDEFVLILEDVSRQQANTMAKRIKDVLGIGFTIDEHQIDIGASVGIAINDGAGGVEDMIDKADKLMYEEKRRS